MTSIEVKDIVNNYKNIIAKVTNENKRLKTELQLADDCVNKLSEFKLFIDKLLISCNFNFNDNDRQKYDVLHKDINQCLQRRRDLIRNEDVFTGNESLTDSLLTDRPLSASNEPNDEVIDFEDEEAEEDETNDNTDGNTDRTGTTDERLYQCSIDDCEEKFKLKYDLLEHKFVVHSVRDPTYREKKFFCDESECRFKTINKSLLERHKQQAHSNDRPYGCYFCGKTYKLQMALKTHMKSHFSDEARNSELIEKFVQNLKPIDHNEELLMKNFNEELLTKNLNEDLIPVLKLEDDIRDISKITKKSENNNTSKESTSSTDAGLFECRIAGCGQRFNLKYDLMEHKVNVHSVKDRNFREKKVHCDQPNCSFRTVNNALLQRHKQQAHSKERPFVCHKCGKSYKISIALKTHMKSHFAQDTKKRLISINKFVCDEPGCNFKASKSDYLIGHKMSVHSNSKVFKCKLESCAMEFATSRGLREHKKSHNRDEVKQSEEMDTEEDMVITFDQSSQKFVCNETNCTYSSTERHLVRRHQRAVHTTERPFKCDIDDCEKDFKTRRSLNEHIKTHSEERPYVCDFEGCNKSYKIAYYLSDHKKTHTGQTKRKKFVCDYPGCGFKAERNAWLQRHKRYHSDERPFECEICGKGFKVIYGLNEHIKIHSGVEQQYRCDWPGCDYRAFQWGNVETHKRRVHTEERNYPCDWPACGKRFKSSADLNDHMRRHTNEKRFACSWPGCQYKAHKGTLLKYHMRRHNDERPHACQWPGCHWKFSSPMGLKKHLKTHNKTK